MLASLILAISVVAAAPGAAPSAEDLEAYNVANAKVGRNAKAHVDLALWCEAHGLSAERLKHLALAVLIEPKNAKARALMGLIAFGGRWERPEAVGQKVQADAEMAKNLAEYNGRRAKTPHSADAQWRLALWCEEHGLKPEAIAHFTTVVRLDPKREAAWKRLGYKHNKGRWVTEAQLANLRAELEIQKQADLRWRKQLATLSIQLGHDDNKAEAIKTLAEVTDPRSVPAIWATFVTGRNPKPALAVQLLGQIDSPVASKALVFLALSSSSSDIRRSAAETLKRRDPREFTGLLITMIREPIKYEAHPVQGPGASGSLRVEGKKFDVQRQYTAPSLPNLQLGPNDFLTYDANGLPVFNEVVGNLMESSFNINSLNNLLTPSINSFGPNSFLTAPVPPGHNPNLGRVQSILANSPLGEKGRELGQALSNSQPTFFDLAMSASSYAQSPLEATYYADLALASRGMLYRNPGDPIRMFDVTTADVAHIPIGQMNVEAQKAAVRAQQQLQNDVADIEQANAQAAKVSAPVLEILKDSTGQDFGSDRQAWSKWLADAQGYAFISNESDNRPTVFEEITPASQPVPVTVTNQVVGFQAISCFGAGTEVYTLTGRRPIETLKTGDRVLTWNTSTGSLAMQPILTVYHNPPSPTLRIEFEEESIVTTPWHRFWQAGKGWVVARDLKPGDLVRTLDQPAKIIGVTPMATQPVFNLEVAEDHNFLVGHQGALVHDNSIAATVSTPFDGLPSAPSTSQGR